MKVSVMVYKCTNCAFSLYGRIYLHNFKLKSSDYLYYHFDIRFCNTPVIS